MSLFGTGVEIAVESVVLFAIGFLLAALMGIACLPAVHNRAARLTSRRLEAATPSSIQEIRVEKDQLRAEFAMSTRRLETAMEELRSKACAQVDVLAQKSNAISHLKSALEERTARMHALEEREGTFESREKSLQEKLRANHDEISRMVDALGAAESLAATRRWDRRRLDSAIAECSRLVDHQRREITALRTEADTIRREAHDIVHSIKQAKSRSGREPNGHGNGATAGNGHDRLNGAHNGGAFEDRAACENVEAQDCVDSGAATTRASSQGVS